MADITLISGSTLGGADEQNTWLKSWKRWVYHRNAARSAVGRFICLGDLADYQLHPRCRRYLDNLSPFYEALQEQKPDLSAVRFGAIGIGSREYDTFCGAIDNSRQNSKIPVQNRQAKH